MAKAPAFQFYPLEFMGDVNVQLMSPEARGAYVFLLCHDWVSGGIPSDDQSLAVLSGTGERWFFVRDQVMKCFQLFNGKFSNARLKRERKKQKDFQSKSVESGKLGAKVRWDKDIDAKNNNRVPYGDPISKNKNTLMGFDGSLSSSSTAIKAHSKKDADYSKIPPEILSEIEELCREATGGFFPQCLDAAVERGTDAILGALDKACQMRKDKGKPVGWAFIQWALDSLPAGYQRNTAGRKMTEQEEWDEGPDDF